MPITNDVSRKGQVTGNCPNVTFHDYAVLITSFVSVYVRGTPSSHTTFTWHFHMFNSREEVNFELVWVALVRAVGAEIVRKLLRESAHELQS
eukprot:4774174-Amphidinium_carterae.1